MEVLEYFTSTLTNSFKILAPYVAFIVGGYFIFIKMPFLFLKKSLDDQKKKLGSETKEVLIEKKYTVEDYEAFKAQIKLINGTAKKENNKKEGPKEERTQSHKKNSTPPRERKVYGPSPEEILGFKKNEPITKAELKKRYFELLKQNHPDRVASMGADFKKLADKNTKEINQAYEVLKNKAA
jgi:hypothetical protein